MVYFHRRTTRPVFVSAVVHLMILVVCIWVPSASNSDRGILLLSSPEVNPIPVIHEPPSLSVEVSHEDQPFAGSMQPPALAIRPPVDVGSPNTSERGPALSAGNTGPSSAQGGATFFGTAANGSRFVYLVDASTSMNDGQGRRFRRACQELMRSVERLREDQSFYVFFFSSTTRGLFDETTPRWRAATEDNKRDLRDWVATLRPVGGTRPQEALYLAAQLKPSAIFLLSDGDFSGERRSQRGGVTHTPLQVVRSPQWGNIPIHSLAMENRAGQSKLQALAGHTGGVYRYVKGPLDFYREEYQAIWDHFGLDPNDGLPDPPLRREFVALQKLRDGDRDALAGRPINSERSYQKVLEHYPDTLAAQLVRQRIRSASKNAQ